MTDAMGRVRRYEYDALGRMTAEVKPLGQRKTTTFDAVGQPISMRDHNGRASTMSYDSRGRLIHAAWCASPTATRTNSSPKYACPACHAGVHVGPQEP